MEEQAAWKLRYLQARVVASERADEVLALLRAAQDGGAAVRALASMLQVDDQAAQGVLDQVSLPEQRRGPWTRAVRRVLLLEPG